MAQVKNIAPGARGIHDAGGNVILLEPGESRDIDLPAGAEPGEWFEFDGVPNISAPSQASGAAAAAAVATLTERAEFAEAQVEELQAELAALKRSAPVVAAAVASLDAKNDDHWTKQGDPAVDAIKAIIRGDVSRADIEAAAPDAKRPA